MVLQSQGITKSLYNMIFYHVILLLISIIYISSTHASISTSFLVISALLLTCQHCVLHWLFIVNTHDIIWLFRKALEIDFCSGRNIIAKNQENWVQVLRLPLTGYVTLDKSLYLLNLSFLIHKTEMIAAWCACFTSHCKDFTLTLLITSITLCFNCLFTFLCPPSE